MARRWFSRRALGLHATALVVVPGCLALGWWQLSCALGGNDLSWVYTFEWPFFAAYGVYMWWKLIHEPLSETRAVELSAPALEPAPPEDLSLAERVDALGFDPYDDDSDPELAAYNRYLANLHAADRKATSRRARNRITS